jgi:hypothetical protein
VVPVVGLDRLGGPSVGSQGQHEHLDRSTPQRLVLDQDAGRGDRVGQRTGIEQPGSSLLAGGRPQLLQPDRRGAGEPVGELAVRGPPPQGQTLVEQAHGCRWIGGPEPARLAEGGLEPVRVERRGLDVQLVTRRPTAHA